MRHTTIEAVAVAAAVIPVAATAATRGRPRTSPCVRRTGILLTTDETVERLIRRLGSPVAWGAWLADIRRNPRKGVEPPSLYGLQLLPAAHAGHQVLYAPADVHAFIDAVLAADPGVKKANAPCYYVFDDFGPLQPWRTRKARRVITPTKPALFKRKKCAA